MPARPRPALRTALALLAAALFAAPAAAQRASIPSKGTLRSIGLERMFLARAPIDSGRDATRRLSGDEEVVFHLSKSGVVTAFDAESGRLLWTQLAGGRPENVSAVITDIDTAYVVIGERLYAFDKLTGAAVWSLRIPFVPVSAPVFDDERMYVGTLDGSVYAFDLAKVREYGRLGDSVLNQYLDQTIAWRYRVGGRITSAPVFSEETICFTSNNGSLFSIRADSREEVFQYETDRSVSARLVAADGILYMAGLDATLYAIDMETGQTLWEFVSGRQIVNSPRLIGTSIFLAPQRDGLYRIARRGGRKLWQRPGLTNFLAKSDDRVYAFDEQGRMHVLGLEDGRDIATLPLRRFSFGLPNEKTDRVYVASRDGVVMGLRETGAEFPIFHSRPDLKPILPPLAEAE